MIRWVPLLLVCSILPACAPKTETSQQTRLHAIVTGERQSVEAFGRIQGQQNAEFSRWSFDTLADGRVAGEVWLPADVSNESLGRLAADASKAGLGYKLERRRWRVVQRS